MSAPSSAPDGALDLATLESFDAGGGRGTELNRRFCCPLCGIEKPRDVAHRSLIYRTDSGAWNCKRCGARGKLRDFWEERDGSTNDAAKIANGSRSNWRRARAQSERAALSQLRDDRAPIDASAQRDDTGANWRARLRGLEPLAGTPGAAYLASRGIPLDVASLAGVRFCADWMRSEKWRGAPAAVFPLRDRAGALVAAQGRFIGATSGAKALTSGPKARGAFMAPAPIGDAASGGREFGPLDARGPGVIITEAPIDALSLAACGFPALALCGINGAHTTGPAWLPLVCGLRAVYLAFDADAAGDEAARALAARLAVYGARCVTLRPEGAKDWNEALQARGRDALSDWIAARVLA